MQRKGNVVEFRQDVRGIGGGPARARRRGAGCRSRGLIRIELCEMRAWGAPIERARPPAAPAPACAVAPRPRAWVVHRTRVCRSTRWPPACSLRHPPNNHSYHGSANTSFADLATAIFARLSYPYTHTFFSFDFQSQFFLSLFHFPFPCFITRSSVCLLPPTLPHRCHPCITRFFSTWISSPHPLLAPSLRLDICRFKCNSINAVQHARRITFISPSYYFPLFHYV